MDTKHGVLSAQAPNRLHGGNLILKGYEDDEIAEIVEVSTSAIREWRQRLEKNDNDLSCLRRKPGSGKHSQLTEDQKAQLKEILKAGARAAGYPTERWVFSKNVADVIQKTFGVTMAPRTVRDLLPTLGFSPQIDSNHPASILEKHQTSLIDEFTLRPSATAKEAAARIEKLIDIKRSPESVRVFMIKIGMKFRKTAAIPAKADLEKQEAFKKKCWSPK